MGDAARSLIESAIGEVGAAAVVALIRKGLETITQDAHPIEHSVYDRVKGILGDKLQSEIEYEAAISALRTQL